MTDLEIQRMSERDLLVTAVSLLNQQGAKIDRVGNTVDNLENRLTTLETEHKLRTNGNKPCDEGQSKAQTPLTVIISSSAAILLYLLARAIAAKFGLVI